MQLQSQLHLHSRQSALSSEIEPLLELVEEVEELERTRRLEEELDELARGGISLGAKKSSSLRAECSRATSQARRFGWESDTKRVGWS